MYKVELLHFHPSTRNGDREETTDLVYCDVYKTKKAAKSYVLWQTMGKKIKVKWGVNKDPSYIYWFTGKTWINENSGEKREERYTYKIIKV